MKSDIKVILSHWSVSQVSNFDHCTECFDEILSQKISTILSKRRVKESTLDGLSRLLVKESVQMGFSIIFWSHDPYNWYVVLVVLGPHSKILLENSQNLKLPKLRIAKLLSCQN